MSDRTLTSVRACLQPRERERERGGDNIFHSLIAVKIDIHF